MGEYEKALPLYKRALEIVEKKLGPKHPNTVTINNNYNWLLSKMSEENKEKLFLKFYNIVFRSLLLQGYSLTCLTI